MTPTRAVLFALAAALAAGPLDASAGQFAPERTATPLAARAQEPASPQVPIEATPDDLARIHWRTRNVAVRVGQDYHLRSGESVRDVIVVSGTATIDGYVRGNVNVVLGTLRLGSTAVIEGALVVVGGHVSAASGATVRRDFLIVGGTFEGPPDFSPGRDHMVIGAAPVLDAVKGFLPWITEGLLLGRPIVPRLAWVWVIVGIVFLVSLALNLIFLDAVRMCAASLSARPLSTFLVGLLVLLLTGPLAVILAASVIGLAVVPFLLCAVAVAWILGKVGVSMWVGGSITGQPVPETRLQGVTAFVLGFAVITLAYMVPILGFALYGLVGVLGLGAAALAFSAAYRRENPARPKAAPPTGPEYFSPEFPGPDVSPASAGEATMSDSFQSPAAPPPAAPPAAAAAAAPPAAAATTDSLLFFPRAEFVDRLAAFALDCVLVLIIYNSLDFSRNDSAPILMLLAYHIGFWTWKGTTIGGIICQLRVVRVTGEPLRFVDALVRAFTSLFSLAVLGLGCFWILKDPERQSWHDKVAGTYVVKVPRNWPL
jgi:uncharacterized RDD family membrane protein YckC